MQPDISDKEEKIQDQTSDGKQNDETALKKRAMAYVANITKTVPYRK